MKNNFSDVKIWNISEGKWDNTGLKNCGLIMGDHAKAGINTMFNTGTVVGLGVNHFGADFPVKYIPNFTWGTNTEKYQFDEFIEAEILWMKTKNKTLTESYLNVLKYYYEKEN